MKIKAAVCRAINSPVTIEELELAEPREHEVQVKHLAGGVCHSDLSMWTGSIPFDLPMVYGHEVCSVVEKVGPRVTTLKPGDRVIGSWMVSCGHCYQCLSGRPNLCETNMEFFTTGNLLDGTGRLTDKDGKWVGLCAFIAGFATHSIMPEMSSIRVPDHIKLPPEQLCLLGCCVATGWGSVVNVAKAHEGDAIGIWGCGGVGLNAIRTAALRHCNPVVAVDLEASKRDIAMEFGATHFIDNSKDDPIPIIKELTNGKGLEYAIEAIGDPGAQVQAWWSLRQGGTMIATGVVPEGSTTSMPLFYLPMGARSIRGHLWGETRSRVDMPRLLELMNAGILKTDKLVTRLIKLEDLNETFRSMLNREIIGRWVIKYD